MVFRCRSSFAPAAITSKRPLPGASARRARSWALVVAPLHAGFALFLTVSQRGPKASRARSAACRPWRFFLAPATNAFSNLAEWAGTSGAQGAGSMQTGDRELLRGRVQRKAAQGFGKPLRARSDARKAVVIEAHTPTNLLFRLALIKPGCRSKRSRAEAASWRGIGRNQSGIGNPVVGTQQTLAAGNQGPRAARQTTADRMLRGAACIVRSSAGFLSTRLGEKTQSERLEA